MKRSNTVEEFAALPLPARLERPPTVGKLVASWAFTLVLLAMTAALVFGFHAQAHPNDCHPSLTR